MSFDGVLQLHGFFLDKEKALISFDTVIEFRSDRHEIFDKLCAAVKEKYPQYTFEIALDSDVSD